MDFWILLIAVLCFAFVVVYADQLKLHSVSVKDLVRALWCGLVMIANRILKLIRIVLLKLSRRRFQ